MANLTNKEIVAGFFEIYNTKDYSTIYQFVAANYFDHSLPEVRSAAAAIAILESVHQSFPDIQVKIDDLIEEDNKVVFRGHFTASHLGEFRGIPPTGNRIQFEALEIFKVENQKITESWGYWPMSNILDQIQARSVSKNND